MKHQVRCSASPVSVSWLPDGRRIVRERDQRAKILDVGGAEMTPSDAELAFLLALANLKCPLISAKRTRRFNRHVDDHWSSAA